MINKYFVWLLALFIGVIITPNGQCSVISKVSSPNGNLFVELLLENGAVKYRVFTHSEEIISPSKLGFAFKNQPALGNNFELLATKQRYVDEHWQKVWGQSKTVNNNFNEVTIALQETLALQRQLNIIFRAYDDGIGFRYELPSQPNFGKFAITAEQTEFTLVADHSAWWIPADFDSYEAIYQRTPLSRVKAVNTPITLKTSSGLLLSIHEAALTDYAGMTLKKLTQHPYRLVSDLVPWPDGIKVKGQAPFKTPWRTIQVAHSEAQLIESNLIENLNEPSVITDTSWIKPMKYVGIWWGMHMRKYTWQAGPKHGATTENTLAYIDFAKEHNIGGVLVEGWNQGWETWHTGVSVQDFTQAYDDFDLAKIAAYGEKHQVALIGHHETGGNIPLYEQQLEQAMALYQKVGVHAIKTGYAGNMLPEGTYHHGQYMVNHYRKVVELAAKHQIMLNVHEPIKPTGIRRTYPNMMTREGGRGMEWNGWSEGNSPEHTVTLPFTRLLAGPMDYTPGIFNLQFDPQQQYRVHSTLARQLALYVVLYSPMQMAADMIENYHDQPAFEFIENVATSWDETRVLNGEIGDYISIARRKGQQWFIGSLTDENPRMLSLSLDFLDKDQAYLARVFSDSKQSDYYQAPSEIAIQSYLVRQGDTLEVALAGSGGHALYLSPMDKKDLALYPTIAQHNQQAQRNIEFFKQARRYGEITRVEHLAAHKKIKILSPYDQGYSAGGDHALIDGVMGNADYKSLWQGYRNNDLDVVIDLGKSQVISSIEIGFLQSVLHSILFPSKVSFFLSDDAQNYLPVGELSYQTLESVPDYQQKRFSLSLAEQSARYIRVQAKNLNTLPQWHQRAGQECFIFADEIIVH